MPSNKKRLYPIVPLTPLPPPEPEISVEDEEELSLATEPDPVLEPEPTPETEPVPETEPEPVIEPEPESQGGFEWIGSDRRPEASRGDGISDLFTVTDEDLGSEDLSDLTDLDVDRDVMDDGPEGGLDDLLEVSEADIMGDEEHGQPLAHNAPRRQTIKPRPARRLLLPPPTVGGLRG